MTYVFHSTYTSASVTCYSFAYSTLGLLEDRNVGIGVFAESEEILVGSFCFCLSPDKANALPSRKCASAPMGSLTTIPR